jgi:hypothetical protein
MRPSDTSPQSHALQFEIYSRLGPERRVALAASM